MAIGVNVAFIATSGDASMRNTDPLRNAYPGDFFHVRPRKDWAATVIAVCALVVCLVLTVLFTSALFGWPIG